jgi:hypothetical protein
MMNTPQKPQLHKHSVSNSYCSVCKSTDNVRFVQITDCNLCEKCDNDLAESFELASKMDRSDYPEL